MLFCACAGVAVAQPAGTAEPKTVAKVVVQGNKHMSRQAVLAFVKTRVGELYSDDIVNADKNRMLSSGRFSSVVATKTQTADGIVVTFVLVERPLVAKLAFHGNKAFNNSELAKELRFGVFDAFSRFSVERGRQDLLRKYRGGGYHFASVTVDADALQRREVIYRITEGPKVVIRRLGFEGNSAFSSMRLRQEVGVSQRLWPFVAGILDSEEVERSVNSIRNLYVSEGYLDAEIGRRLQFSDDKTKVSLTFVIKEGQRYRVNRVIFRGNRVFSGRSLQNRIRLRQGAYFTRLQLTRDLEKLNDTYGEIGYIGVSVKAQRIFVDPTAPSPAWAKGLGKVALLNIIFTIREGRQYRVGAITIRGNTVTQSRVIRRELTLEPTQLFNTVALNTAERRLRESGLFERVDIIRTGQLPEVRDVIIRVKEGKTAQFLVGVGVSSSSGLLGNISFRQRNFDILGWPRSWRQFMRGEAFKGAGQTLSIVAEPGVELMRLYINWFEPYLMDQPYSLGVKSFLFTRGRESYDETRYGGVVSVGHRFKNRWYGELAARIEGVDVSNLESDAPVEVMEDAGTHLLLGLKGTLVRDRTDSRWLPSRGDRIRVSYEQVVGDFNFGKIVGEYRIYRTVYVDALDRKHIIAGRFSAGYVTDDAPVFERFYGGGIGSVRGFRYRGISPRGTASDDPIGGDFMAFAGGEYTFPLIGKGGEGQVRGVLFLDTGTVESDFGVTTYRVSAGFGIRWTVPFFGPIPISLDFGFPLNKNDEDDDQIFSFSLGWTF